MDKKSILIVLLLFLTACFVMVSNAAGAENAGVVGGEITLTYQISDEDHNNGNLKFIFQKDTGEIVDIISIDSKGNIVVSNEFKDRVTIEHDKTNKTISVTIKNITKEDIGNYQIVLEDHKGDTTGSSYPGGIDYIYNQVEIDVSPSDVVVFEGPATLFVEPVESEDMEYQWYKSDAASLDGTDVTYSPIDGENATRAAYIFDANHSNDDGYWYKVVVSAGPAELNNRAESEPAKLTVLKTPTLKENPIYVIETIENEAVFYVDERLNDFAASYVLQKKTGDVYQDVTEKSPRTIENGFDVLTIAADIQSAGFYRIVGTMENTEKIISQDIELKVFRDLSDEISVTVAPDMQTVYIGQTATLTAAPAGVPQDAVVSYQWYDENDQEISSATEETYTPDTSAIGTETYYVIMTVTLDGTIGTATSDPATVTV
ncbi:hypothetical protein, partial [Methanolapillus africanus]|uniref:hypothetical protein n=1 Tax=Methanolapillus africanus TaxID=3028297 RepID=UPI0030B87927